MQNSKHFRITGYFNIDKKQLGTRELNNKLYRKPLSI